MLPGTETHDRLRLFLDLTGFHVFECELPDGILETDDATLFEWLGSAGSLTWSAFLNRLTETSCRQQLEQLAKGISTEKILSSCELLRSDGSTRSVEICARPVSPSRILVVLREVSTKTSGDDGHQHLRGLMELLPVLAWISDAQGELHWCNRRCLEFTGMSLAELQGAGWRRVQHPDHIFRSTRKLQRAARATEAWEDVHPLRSRTGEYKWFLSRAVPLSTAKAQPTRWFGVSTDITALVEASEFEKLRDHLTEITASPAAEHDVFDAASQALARTLNLECCVLAEVVAGREVVVLFAQTAGVESLRDRYAVEIFGRTALNEARAGRTVVVHDVQADSGLSRAPESPELASIGAFVLVPLHRAGQWIGLLLAATRKPRVWTDAEVTLLKHAAHALWNRIETKRLVRAVQESEQSLRVVMDALPDMVWIADRYGQVMYYNARWAQFSGKSMYELQGDGWAIMVHPDDLERVKAVWAESVRTGANYEVEARLRDSTGEYRWVVGRAQALRDERGAVTRWIGVNSVIESQKAATEALEHANRRLARVNEDLREYAYAASHDLQEPVRMVIVFSQLLLNRFSHELSDEARAYLHYEVEGARRIEQLVKDLRDYWAMSELPSSRPEALELGEVVEIAKAHLHTAIAETHAEITYDPLPTVKGERIPLVSLMHNLLSNALKFRSPTDRVQVRIHATKDDDGFWTIGVQDNGIGIPEMHQEFIFGLFKRLHTREQYPGSGLGLAICRTIVERYGGRIWVESEEGLGSTFYFTIPPA